tara:strand:- start:9067 stop:9576 length:510 start_codon:yes stop_codon:yes gene_type:complete
MNATIDLWQGTLTMCDILDFRDTLEKEHTVYTLCKYPPKYINSDKQDRYHFYFRAHDEGTKSWVIAVNHIEELLKEGKNVLLHCVHGRDRTGGVAYVLIRKHGTYNHEAAARVMKEVRPSMAKAWDGILEQRRDFYERILAEAQVYNGHLVEYFNHETKSERGIPYKIV